MARFFHLDFSAIRRSGRPVLLAALWSGGLFVGYVLYIHAGVFIHSMMHSVLGEPVSIVSLLVTAVFPFFAAASAVFLSGPLWLPILAFVRAVCFSYCSLGICMAFGASGWLLRWLLLFSRFAAAPLFYWYLRHYISGERPFSPLVLFFLLCLILLMGCLDYCMISPFLVNLIDYTKG